MSKLADLADYLKPATDEHGSPVLQKEYDLLRFLLRDWLCFAKDVSTSDCAGQDWLDGLRGRTKAALEEKP